MHPDPNWKPHRENADAKYDDSSVTGAVETRATAEKKAKPTKHLRTADPTPEISKYKFIVKNELF